MKYLCIILLSIAFFKAKTQDTSLIKPGKKDTIYDAAAVQQQAEYPGGMSAMMNFIAHEVKYPKECADKEIGGKVYVEFVVDIEGKVTKVRVKRSAHPLLDAEAMRVVSLFPDWKPGINDGKNVRQRFIVPINFMITHTEEEKGRKGRKK